MVTKIQHSTVEEIGRNTWKDNRGNVYILNKDKTEFLKMTQQQSKVWQILNMKIVSGFIVAFLIDYYFQTLFIGILIGIVVYALIEAYYRIKFIPTLVSAGKIKNQDDISHSTFFNFSRSTKKEILKRTFMLLILDALLIINYVQLDYSPAYLLDFTDTRVFLTALIYTVFMVLITGMAIIYFIVWIKKKD